MKAKAYRKRLREEKRVAKFVKFVEPPKIKREFRTPVRFDVVLDFVARVLLI